MLAALDLYLDTGGLILGKENWGHSILTVALDFSLSGPSGGACGNSRMSIALRDLQMHLCGVANV